ncbi:MAG: phosphodiester glycosidase family protein [Clostridia bacterium]|nr:phosphodiester glycosidase family protein [Clostridia bacterium]
MRRFGQIFRMLIMCTVLTGTLLVSTCAKGDLLLFATAEDCEKAPASSWTLNDPHAVVLEKAAKGKQNAAKEALAKAGISDVTFLELAAVKAKNRTTATLEKKWATKENTAKIASLIRQRKDDCVLYYASAEEDLSFLSAFADKCAAAANDPSCRRKKQQDEYLHEAQKLIDGTTNEERAASPADTSWRTAWEDNPKYDLSALPETDAEGFLADGEYVLEDSKQGLWVYLSKTLRVVITHHKTKGYSWFEADILRRPEGETLHVVTSLNGRGNDPVKVAAENKLVFGVNTDYYLIRVNYRKKVGLVIRDGKVIRESVGATTGTSLPPLDTLLLDYEGGFRVDKAGDLDSAKALELGARDVLAFGPILIRDSLIRMLTVSYHHKKEPRTAVGLLGDNHYLAVVAEGRLSGAAGMTLDELGQLMAVRGCTQAFNLDGGHTSALIFMGKRLNKIGNLTGTGTTSPRNMSELLGIGTYSGNN